MRICDDLRQAVLQAAIQGKLTKQLPEDGDAADLLKQFKNEKERLLKEKKIIPKKPTAPFFEVEDLEVLNIPNNWTMAQLSEVSLIQEGAGIRKWQYREEGIQLLCVTNILDGAVDLGKKRLCISTQEYKEKYVHLTLNVGDIVCSCSGGSWGKSAIYDKPDIVMLNTSTLRLRFFGDLADNLYLYYLTKSEWFKKQLRKQLSGMQPNFGYAHYSRIIIPLPPLAEQNRIVAKVEELMARIDDLEKTESELEKLKAAFPGDMKAALLQAAMQGKLTEQLPGESLDEITSHLVYDERIESPKEIPFNIPDNWQWIQIGNLGQSTDTNSFSDGPFGSNLKREHQINKSEVRIIQLSNIGETGWKNDNEKYTSFKHLEDVIPRCEVLPGDLVIAKMMPAGRTIEVPDLGTRITLGSDAMKFKPNNILNKRYLLYAMRSQAFLGQVYADAHGITRVRTTLKGIKSYVLPIPPLAEQKRIVEKLDKLLPLCDGLVEE